MKSSIGWLVEHQDIPGIGRIGAVDGLHVQVDCFESIAAPAVGARWLPVHEFRRVRLLPQTRVFRHDPDTGEWRAGRVVGGGPATYFVRMPNAEHDSLVPESQLRVRWDRPIDNPIDVLVVGANESPYFRDARLPMLESLVAQRAACAGIAALVSSAVEIYPHQVRAALTVLSDPVQRYLIADEVGLGKTIEAGLVIRQTLLDRPCGRVVVLAPDVLRRQWQAELREKFFIDDFSHATLKIGAHEMPQRWSAYHGFDLVVIDEAHRLVEVDGPDQSPYRELVALADSTPRLLLLSATPVTSRPTMHLGLLHLLDQDLYRWENQAEFRQRFDLRRQLASAVYALDADFTSLLGTAIDEIADLVPEDPLCQGLANRVMAFLTADGDLIDEAQRADLTTAVEALRAHISETYRLHRRMIRHRRANVLRDDPDADVLPYEVRGRAAPQAVMLDSAEHQAAQDTLQAWQTRVADWLHDHDQDERLVDYGHTLAVLVSRAGGPVGDLADALRWRLRGDAEAAQRAGLSAEERVRMTTLPVLAPEADILEMLDGAEPDSGAAALVDALAPIVTKCARSVLFCGPGSLAATLCDALRSRMPEAAVGEHTARAGTESCDRAVARWRKDGGVLVVDDTAEDGLNLQQAEAAVHCRLPASPNRLEQRLGRVDRYVGMAPGARSLPVRQYVVAYAEGSYCLSGAWLALLTDGFAIFDESLSALQDAIDQGGAELWSAAMNEGPRGLVGCAQQVRERLARERKDIDGMDLLESVHGSTSGSEDVASTIGRLEMQWKGLEDALVGYAGDRPGGLRFHMQHTDSRNQQVVRFVRGHTDPLIAPRLLARAQRTFGASLMEGVFNRNIALRLPATRLFRYGHPFVDLLASVIDIDDRGQASAFWRCDHSHRGEPQVYFGMDYLVEADAEAAMAVVSNPPEVRLALRRQADRILPPFLRRVWVPAAAQDAIADGRLLTWLNHPYDPNRGDVNFNPNRFERLVDLFAGRDQFARAAREAEEAGRRELSRVTDLTARCAAAQEQAARTIAIMRAQAQARQAAGRLVCDAESYLVDVTLADALASGLSRPQTRLMAVTCLVRGAPETDHCDG